MKITHTRHYEQLKIYFGGILHLQIKLLDLIGFQSWVHGEKEYFIEYTFNHGTRITCAYSDRNRWEKVLQILDKHLQG